MECPVCGSRQIKPVSSRPSQICSSFWGIDGEPPRVDITIASCFECTFVFFIEAYEDPAYRNIMNEVYNSYTLMENAMKSFPVSEVSIEYARDFILSHIDTETPMNAFEIGSNRGDFLYHMKNAVPHFNVLGIEPSKLKFFGVPTLNIPFDADLIGGRFDLGITRHVLEHIVDQKTFLTGMISILNESGSLYVEVPNLTNDLAMMHEPFIAEHINHFTIQSLRVLMRSLGMEIYAELNKVGMPLCVMARRSHADKGVAPEIDGLQTLEKLEGFMSGVTGIVSMLEEHLRDGYQLVFYGAGNVFLSVYGVLEQALGVARLAEATRAVLDDSPQRIGRSFYGHQVSATDCINTFNKKRLFIIACTLSDVDRPQLVAKLVESGIDKSRIIIPWDRAG